MWKEAHILTLDSTDLVVGAALVTAVLLLTTAVVDLSMSEVSDEILAVRVGCSVSRDSVASSKKRLSPR